MYARRDIHHLPLRILSIPDCSTLQMLFRAKGAPNLFSGPNFTTYIIIILYISGRMSFRKGSKCFYVYLRIYLPNVIILLMSCKYKNA